jgi:hypothetical protein
VVVDNRAQAFPCKVVAPRQDAEAPTIHKT